MSNWVRGWLPVMLTVHTFVAKTTKLGYSVRLMFQYGVHHTDIEIMYKLKHFFNGVGEIVHTKEYVYYRIWKLQDILNVVIPHFNMYPLQSTKLVSYNVFCEVVETIKSKEHLTLEGIKKIKSLKSGMNSSRIL